MIGVSLVIPPMPHILLAVRQKIAVQLPYMVFGQCNGFERHEDRFHDDGVARDFLFIAGGKVTDFDVGQEPFDLVVRKATAFDAGG